MDYVKGLGEGTVVRCRLLNCDKPDNNGNIYTKQAIEDAVGKFKAQSIKYVYSSLDKPDISNRLGTILDMTLGYDGALEALVRFDPNDDCVDPENKLIVENIQKALLDGDLKKISVSFSAQMEEEDVLVDENGNSVVKKCVITHMSVEAVKINN